MPDAKWLSNGFQVQMDLHRLANRKSLIYAKVTSIARITKKQTYDLPFYGQRGQQTIVDSALLNVLSNPIHPYSADVKSAIQYHSSRRYYFKQINH